MTIKKTLIATAFSVASISMTMAPMTVFAGGAEKECICETKCSEDEINKDCEICDYDYTYCEGKEEEHWGPLTPDGNMDLVDDYGSLEAGGKQFITVTTKAGNFFYIIIDRDDQGAETVHFLNLVDEADLLALMDDEQVEEYLAATQDKEEEPVVIEDEPVPGATEEPVEEPVVVDKQFNIGLFLLPVLVVIIGAIVIVGKLMKKKKEKEAIKPDPDFDYDDDSMSDFLDEDLSEDDLTDSNDYTEDDSEE